MSEREQRFSTPVQTLVDRIVETAHPRRIILFGSAARSGLAPPRDIDVLVVMPPGTHRRKTAQQLYAAIRGIGVPFDILVATQEDLDRERDNVGLIFKSVLDEGREVYAA